MTLRAQKSGLKKLVSNNGISIWSYHCTNHILDVMIKPRFFARLSDPFEPGDIILVDCPGYYEILRFLGYPPRPVHRPGGGVLQVETKQESGLMTLRIVGLSMPGKMLFRDSSGLIPPACPRRCRNQTYRLKRITAVQ